MPPNTLNKVKKEDLPKSSFNSENIRKILLGWNIIVNKISYNENIKDSDILKKNDNGSFDIVLPNQKDFFQNKKNLIIFLKKLYKEFYSGEENDVFEPNNFLLNEKFSVLKKYSSKKSITSLSQLSLEKIKKDLDISFIELGKIQVLKNFDINGKSLIKYLENKKNKYSNENIVYGETIKKIINDMLDDLWDKGFKPGTKSNFDSGIATTFMIEGKTFCVNSVYLFDVALEYLGLKTFGFDGGLNTGKGQHIMLGYEYKSKKFIVDNRALSVKNFNETMIKNNLIEYTFKGKTEKKEYYTIGNTEEIIFSNNLYRFYLENINKSNALDYLLKAYEVYPKNIKVLYVLSNYYKEKNTKLFKFYNNKLNKLNPNFMKNI